MVGKFIITIEPWYFFVHVIHQSLSDNPMYYAMTLTSELIIVQLSHFVLYLISEDQGNDSKTFLQTTRH